MEIRICKNSKELGSSAAKYIAKLLRDSIAEKGNARILLSTGASQFDTMSALIKEDVDWSKVEMFHLDEYIGIDETHKASFRKYLKERFISQVNLKAAHLVDGTPENMEVLSNELKKEPIDVGVVGIGENSHIAFNDPPANFDTKDAYIVVDLNETCKKQQVGEGWFPTIDDVPKQAVSMSVHQIMQCKRIVTCVPYAVKAKAIKDTLTNDTNNMIPATMLKNHENFVLYIDADSAAQVKATDILWK